MVMELPAGMVVVLVMPARQETGFSPGVGRSWRRNGNPCQYSAQKIPGTEEPGGLTVHGVAKSQGTTELLHTQATSF